MRTLTVMLLVFSAGVAWSPRVALADTHGNELAHWINERGREVWGSLPERCDDLTFARRLYLDVIGRVPSVSELRDFQDLGEDRRDVLVNRLVFGEGPRGEIYQRLQANHLAKQWRRVLIPPGTTVSGTAQSIESWLSDAFASRMPYDEMMRELAAIQSPESAGGYYRLLGSLPENYAGHLSRTMLGVRIECAQCHDHPFVDWAQEDFWGLAAFYSDLSRAGDAPNASENAAAAGSIKYEGMVYQAKFLWSDEPVSQQSRALRTRFADWLTAPDNPHFSATAVNRFWQHLVGRGLYADVENLDLATSTERDFLDELGGRFARNGYKIHQLIAAIAKSNWYQAANVDRGFAEDEDFERPLKVLSPEQVFDSLEQSLMLPVSRVDPASPRWSGEMSQLVTRLSETVGATPQEYAAGIPQALLLMNGKLTRDAVSLEQSRLLRAVIESPFFSDSDRVKTLYLAVLTREPTDEEADVMATYVAGKPTESAQRRAYGEILWALLNSPEFVLCR